MAKNIATETFTTSGSWTAPAGVTYVTVRMSGGGAGGVTGTDFENGAPIGAAGGASPERIFNLTVVPATSYTITIGSGGSGGTSSPALAGDGGDTTFGSLATAIGTNSADNIFEEDVSARDEPIGFPSLLVRFADEVNGTSPYGSAVGGPFSEFGFNGFGGFNGPNGGGGLGGISAPIAEILTGDVNTSTDTFNVTAHGFTTQDEVLAVQFNTLPSPLVDSTSYFVIRTDDDNFQLATTFANAGTGTQIDITDVGSGTPTGLFISLEAGDDGGDAVANSGGGGGGGGFADFDGGSDGGDGGDGGSGFLEVTWSE